jgi:elongation factor G
MDPKTLRRLADIRNLGIAAHIDAGKTTVSERILFLTGTTNRIGEVHDGRATMDFMKQEQERGITIASAAITCSWKGRTLNLIDTPGHVDFTMEVERSLRVLDGMVGVFCAVGGVEPQSETVWGQADLHRVPRIAFVNKMDRPGADFFACVSQMREILDTNAVAYQYPIYQGDAFVGLVDLIDLSTWSLEGFDATPTEIPPELLPKVVLARNELIERVSEWDDVLLERFLEGQPVTADELRRATRSAVTRLLRGPVFCGAAYRNAGVQHLLDAIVDYLPSPLDVGAVVGSDPQDPTHTHTHGPSPDGPLAALAFKIIHDPYVGQQTFVRIYSGRIQAGDTLYNSTRDARERVGRILRIKAKDREDVKVVEAGDIVALVGLKNTTTGNTLCSPDHPLLLESIRVPQAVISLRITGSNQGEQEKIAKGLAKLAMEDPSFLVTHDEETNDFLLSGMGELHLEILVDRLRTEFGVDCVVGQPSVSYRESLGAPTEAEYRHVKQTGGHGQFGHVVMRFEPTEKPGLEFVVEVVGGRVPREYHASIRRGVEDGLGKGPLAGYPVVGVRAVLLDGSYHAVDSSDMAFRTTAFQCFKKAFLASRPRLLEPIMEVEINTPDEHIGDIVGDLGSRRGKVIAMRRFRKGSQKVSATAPLGEMFGYSTPLRSMSSGRATFSMEFERYEPVPEALSKQIIEARKDR